VAFQCTKSGTVFLWRGNPNCHAAQKFVRNWLRANSPIYPVVWGPDNARLKGNLGECIAFCCMEFAFGRLPHCLAANALKTLSNISRPGIDLLWIGFAPDPSDDFMIQQEVKTTTDLSLAYASALLTDYRKSFGSDPNVTLNTHLQAFKSKLKYEWRRPDLVDRVNALQAPTPKQADRLLIFPTLVHDANSEDPVLKLTAIEMELTASGWQKIKTWSIAFNGLENHLKSMAEDA